MPQSRDTGPGVITTAGVGFPVEDFERYVREIPVPRPNSTHAKPRMRGR